MLLGGRRAHRQEALVGIGINRSIGRSMGVNAPNKLQGQGDESTHRSGVSTPERSSFLLFRKMSTFSPSPLTTEFTPPSSCTSLTDACTPGHYYHEWNPSVTTGAWTSCYSPGFTHAWSSSHIEDMYFSPGVCPSGFTVRNSDCISVCVGFWGLSSSS